MLDEKTQCSIERIHETSKQNMQYITFHKSFRKNYLAVYLVLYLITEEVQNRAYLYLLYYK